PPAPDFPETKNPEPRTKNQDPRTMNQEPYPFLRKKSFAVSPV
ncbi:MAG: hypothetical protein RL693_2635, partial [Verrucomicrobiota bacterium]